MLVRCAAAPSSVQEPGTAIKIAAPLTRYQQFPLAHALETHAMSHSHPDLPLLVCDPVSRELCSCFLRTEQRIDSGVLQHAAQQVQHAACCPRPRDFFSSLGKMRRIHSTGDRDGEGKTLTLSFLLYFYSITLFFLFHFVFFILIFTFVFFSLKSEWNSRSLFSMILVFFSCVCRQIKVPYYVAVY